MPRDKNRDYEVGYGKPPRDGQFKRGQSGNPKGRPSGKKSLSTVLSDAVNEGVLAVVGNGRHKKITKLEATVTQLVNKAASGDPKATQTLFAQLRDTESRTDPGSADTAIDEADQQIIQTYQGQVPGREGVNQ